MQPPTYLHDLLREGRGNDNWVYRRCVRHLPVVWMGLREYTACDLASRMEWEERITPTVLHRWYAAYVRRRGMVTRGGDNPNALRWVRYTLNRLLPPHTARVPVTSRASQQGPSLATLRLTQDTEERVRGLLAAPALHGCTARERYALRRLVSAAPVWRSASLLIHGVRPDDVAWFLEHRVGQTAPSWASRRGGGLAAAEVVPRGKHAWFPEALRAMVSRLPAATSDTPPVPHRRCRPLLLSSCTDTHPPHVVLYFRHFFRDDEMAYVQGLSAAMQARGFTPTHLRQVWDYIKSLWMHHAPHEGMPRTDCLFTNDTLWDWLLGVYRHQGGGGLAALGGNGRLPSACNKALTAAQVVVVSHSPHTGVSSLSSPLRVPTRTEYRRRIRMVACLEEPLPVAVFLAQAAATLPGPATARALPTPSDVLGR